MYKKLAELILPKGTLDYFDLVDIKEDGEQIHLYLEEKEEIPTEYKDIAHRKNGFMQERKIKDFSIRDYIVTLHVKRRRWLLIESGKKVKSNWDEVAPGTSMTKDLAAFLKEVAR